MTEIAIIGLGAMGYGIARSILRKGHITSLLHGSLISARKCALLF